MERWHIKALPTSVQVHGCLNRVGDSFSRLVISFSKQHFVIWRLFITCLNTLRTFFVLYTSGRWLLRWVQLGRPTSNSWWWIIQVIEKREFRKYDHWTWLITKCTYDSFQTDSLFHAKTPLTPPPNPSHGHRFEVSASCHVRCKDSSFLVCYTMPNGKCF